MTKRIVMINCLNTIGKGCTGSGCFRALHERTGAFQIYKDDEVNVIAFFTCCGCEEELETSEGLKKKVERILSLNPDAVHTGICTKRQEGDFCRPIKQMLQRFKENGISCIDGTHASH